MERLIGKVFSRVYQDGDAIVFANENVEFKLEHQQECCEHVYIESVVGDLSDLQDSPILRSEASSNPGENCEGTFTWTFHKLATRKGYVDIRFFGESNGYYSEYADLVQYGPEGNVIY